MQTAVRFAPEIPTIVARNPESRCTVNWHGIFDFDATEGRIYLDYEGLHFHAMGYVPGWGAWVKFVQTSPTKEATEPVFAFDQVGNAEGFAWALIHDHIMGDCQN